MCVKDLKGRIEDLFVELRPTDALPAGAKKGDYTEGLSPRTPEFGNAGRICEAASLTRGFKKQIHQIEELARTGEDALGQAKEIEAQLATHKLVEQEAKDVKARIKATENRKQELVETARAAISNKTAKAEIIARLHRLLIDAYRQYLRADQRACVAAIENLWEKYAVTASQIETARKLAAAKLDEFLVELGYD